MEIRNFLLPVAATPASQAILNFVGTLKLIPLAHWSWNEDIVSPITYIVANGSAAVASLLPARKNLTKAIFIAIGLAFLLAAFGIYTYVSTSPPRRSWLWLYEIAGYCSFFITYIAFGFVVARVVKFLVKK